MGYPRSLLVDGTTPGDFHCVSRCVRRAFLCGEDAVTGRSFAHRKLWLEDRLLALAEIIAGSVLAHAVMSNHPHVVLRPAPRRRDCCPWHRYRSPLMGTFWSRRCVPR